MDILQSVPILGFLPIAVIVLKAIPLLGSEAATIFLIFSSMAWATLFNVVEGVRAIPSRIKDLSQLMNLKGIRYLTHVVIPAIEPQIISGAIAGWGGGWYFLVVGEFTTFGSIPHEVPGIGQFIAESAYAGEIALSLLGIWALAAIVLVLNKFVWSPLQERAQSYKEEEPEPYETDNPIIGIMDESSEKALDLTEKIFKWIDPLLERAGIHPTTQLSSPSRRYSIALSILVIVALAGLFIFYQNELIVPNGILEPLSLFWYSLNSVGRILIAYAIALFWTLIAGIFIGRSKKLRNFFMPFFDIGQSIPAVAVFPIIVVSVIEFVGGDIGIEVASILLLLTGMQWYLLFNILRAMQSIPHRISEIGSLLNLTEIQKLRNIILPAIFPAVIAGSIQAIGGGWNATIVSEYILYKADVYAPSGGGLGWLLNVGTAEGSVFTILAAVLTMVIIIIGTDKLIWSRGVKIAEKFSLW
jgi:NitT/TauT family transport system permease protein